MADVLENKRAATRFRILAEIAERQPAVSQGEIADAVGVTSQAVSEYTRALVEDGLVEKEGRSRYSVTKEGVDWLLQEAADVRRFADHVTEDVLGSISEDAAIATDDIEEGEVVTLTMKDGLFHASPGGDGPATGVATTDAAAGADVGVAEFKGIIDSEPGTVVVFQVPPIRAGGASSADSDRLREICESSDLVAATGIEAVVALRKTGHEPATTFAAGEVATEAARRGLDAVVVATADVVGRVTDALRDSDVAYEVSDLS